jgi:hypothetical protein
MQSELEPDVFVRALCFVALALTVAGCASSPRQDVAFAEDGTFVMTKSDLFAGAVEALGGGDERALRMRAALDQSCPLELVTVTGSAGASTVLDVCGVARRYRVDTTLGAGLDAVVDVTGSTAVTVTVKPDGKTTTDGAAPAPDSAPPRVPAPSHE